MLICERCFDRRRGVRIGNVFQQPGIGRDGKRRVKTRGCARCWVGRGWGARSGGDNEGVHGIKDIAEVITESALEVLIDFLEFEETGSYWS